MRELLRRLVELQPGDLPVLSIYLDMRRQATGESPARSRLIVLKDRLREIEKTLGPRGEALDSFRADAARVRRYLEDNVTASTQGLALFACAGRDLFATVQAGVPFENQVSAGPLPDLFQLARLLDEQETAVVALVDSNTARLFVTRMGALEEVSGSDDDSVHYRKRSMGGWSQARYQRHIDKHRADFAREAATEIERLVEQEGAVRLVLAGDEVAITPLKNALSPKMARLVAAPMLRVHIRAPRDDLAAEIRPILAQAEAGHAAGAADQLVGAVRSDGLGVAGLERSRRALTYGQGDVLLLDPQADLDDETCSELILLAAAGGADIKLVENHDRFREMGGVGVLLRYRHDGPVRIHA